ncbi:YqhR family membrane protein [Cohnella fermenti]|uniref:Membrane protein YqhR n=1 Tax=Cohnella fermenti TaxID=2565925 RepID=A0A4V3WEE1_9BACL|nr:YqhR family membrane protein [Cohnella fermenti]THF75922.1 hypothetical protein E6C55_20690 [Cohnella fermenti]
MSDKDEHKRSHEQERMGNRRKKTTARRAAMYALQIGFFAGLIWGLLRWLLVSLKLTNVPQAFLADPWVRRDALNSVFWHCMGLAMFIVMSIVAAFVYWLLLGALRGPWPGIVFGAAWWALLFAAIGPPAGLTESLRVIGWNSIFSELGLYLIWGLFIGYSIAFEFHDEGAREPNPKASGGRGRMAGGDDAVLQ